jgi:hypothetical protein
MRRVGPPVKPEDDDRKKTWTAGTSPAMTELKFVSAVPGSARARQMCECDSRAGGNG